MLRDAPEPQDERAAAWQEDDARWAAWMAAAQRGDKAAYEKLLTEVAAMIRHYLHGRFGPADFIDDITQECLLSIHKGRHTYDAARPFRAWLFAIVRHRSIDHLRRRGSDKATGAARVDLESIDVQKINADGQPHSVSNAVAVAAEASLILSQLSREHRDIIVRTKYLGYSAGEVGTQLGISVGAVRVRLHRALRHARRLFNTEDDTPT
ncbi:MAG: RNA polymerase sigma factor [Gammaproteobacteria bacterium]|nr:RNA polymerase sigma factor [Gammaproteobacteria bacterium]